MYNKLLEIIDKFENGIGFNICNAAGHIVLEDYNLTDENIDWQLKWTEAHRAEIISECDDLYHIDAVIAFMELLKLVPKEIREDE